MRPGLPSRLARKAVTASATITGADIKLYGYINCNTTSAEVTLTWPTPSEDLTNREVLVTNDGAANNVVISCTNGFLRDGDSVTVIAGDSMWLICLPDYNSTYRWMVAKTAAESISYGGEPAAVSSSTSGTAGVAETASRSDHGHDLSAHLHTGATNGGQITSAAISDFTEAVQDAAGAMFSDNTELGVALVYDDANNVTNVAVAFASTEPAEVSTSTSGTAGVASTAARGDHGHDLGTHDHSDGTAGGTIPSTSISDWAEAVADTAGAMFTGNTETGVTVTYQDGDNTIDVEVTYGTEPPAISLSTSGTAGTADSASRSDHCHDLGTHDHSDNTKGGTIAAASVSDFAEVVADTVGAMVTGNTETGISVTYEDGDNTLDFAVTYGTEPAAVSSSTSGTAGSADSASRSDHSHDLGEHVHTGATNGGQLSTASLSDWQTWATWTPTLVFDGVGDPTNLATVARYIMIGKLVFFKLQISGTDGDDKVLSTSTLPQTPKDVDIMCACTAVAHVNGTYKWGADEPGAYIDQTDGTAGNRLLKIANCPTFTNAQSYLLSISGCYEVA